MISHIEQAVFMAKSGICSIAWNCHSCFITEQMCYKYREDITHTKAFWQEHARIYLIEHEVELLEVLL